ncbi:MAG: two-component system sensor histidine kinase NtrB [Blastocatellia bacterium]
MAHALTGFFAGPPRWFFMSPLAVLKLIGFATGAALHLYLCGLLARRRGLRGTERVVLALGAAVGCWHLGNFLAVLHETLEIPGALWWLKSAHVLAYVALALLPPTGFHAQMRVWEWMDTRAPRRWFTILIILGYLPLLLLPWVISRLWHEPYVPPLERLSNLRMPLTPLPLVFAFMLWSVVVLWECGAISLYLGKKQTGARERRFFEILGSLLILQGILNLATYVFGARHWQVIGPYVEAIAMLGSIVPTAIIAWYIYRYRYLEIVIRQSLVYAVVAVIVMMIYLYGIRRFSQMMETRHGLRAGVMEAVLILALVFLAAPLRNLVERYLRKLFVTEVGLYRDLVAQVGAAADTFGEMPRLISFLERRLTEALGLSRVGIIRADTAVDEVAEIIHQAAAENWTHIEDPRQLAQLGALSADVLWREGRVVGLLTATGKARDLTAEKREILSVLSGHIATALANCQWLEEKVRLERALAARERLASLGQMAATVAHEIRNPLSSIKSITQVMREDQLVAREYGRDLDLIVGEVDRLNRSVTQLLGFSRPAVVAATPARLSELIRGVLLIARAEAEEREVAITVNQTIDPELDGLTVSALKEALSNLLVNAIQASDPGAGVVIECSLTSQNKLRIAVTDTGAGIPAVLHEKILEPFFTTRQRGTGLGLAIAARRVRELDGDLDFQSPVAGARGTRFQITIPLGKHPEPEQTGGR